MSFLNSFSRFTKSRFFNYGLPFLIFVVGGSFALSQFTTVRYTIKKHKNTFGVTPEMMEKFGLKFASQTDIDEEYRNMQKTLDIDNWQNIRGPREYEEPSEEYTQLISKLQEKAIKKL